MNFSFPSWSIKIISDNQDEAMLAEMILYNLKLDVAFYLDYRKDVLFKSQTFYILCKDNNYHDPNLKHLVCGPIKSKRSIKTNRLFYNDLIDKLQDRDSDFTVEIKMEADVIRRHKGY